MLILFQSKSSAEVLMFAEHAMPLLRAAGKLFETSELPERGVITRDQLPAAIAGIESLIDAQPINDEPEDASDDSTEHPIDQHVSVRRRAWPLLAMLRLANENNEDVTWEPATVW